MKKYKINLTVALLSVFFISCTENVLDKGPLASFSAENIWTDVFLIDAFMADMYNQAQLIPSGEHFRTRQNTTTFALTSLSDEGRFRGNSASTTGYRHADGRTTGTNTAHVLQIWDSHYKYLRNMNLAIEALSDPESTLDETYREERLGELYFFRAHAYFNMVKRYGGVPIIKEPQDVSLSFEELQVERSTEAEVYDFIAEDLDLAISYLEDKDMHMSRISQWAALVIKSRAMLYAGSIAANNSKLVYTDPNGLVGIDPSEAGRFYQASLDASKKLLPAPYGDGNAPFVLMPGSTTTEYRKIFADAGEEGNTESIMVMEYTGEESLSNEYDFYLLPRASVDHVTWGSAVDCYIESTTWFDYLDGTPGTQLPEGYVNNGSNLLVDNLTTGVFHNLDELWGNKDPRFEACIAIPGMMVGDNISYSHDKVVDPAAAAAAGVPAVAPNQNHINSALHIYKPARPEDPAILVLTGTASINIFRISEIYLNYAEAALGLEQSATGLAALNEIRARVGMPLVSELNMDVVEHERKVELFFERHRYWDLKRWRKAVTPLSTNYNGVDFTYDVANDSYEFRINPNTEKIQRQFRDEHYYLPIPLSEINTNDAIVQNPGY